MVRSTTRVAITQIWKEGILLNPTGGETQVVDGTLTADLAPGRLVVYVHTTGKWIVADANTAAHKLATYGVTGYKKRVRASSNALLLITDNWDVSEAEDKMTPIITSGFVSCLMDDQNAGLTTLTEMMLSTNAGACTVSDEGASSIAGSLADYVIDDDVYCILGIGAYRNKVFSFDGEL